MMYDGVQPLMCCRYKWAQSAENLPNWLSRSKWPSDLQAVNMPRWGCWTTSLHLAELL